MDELETKTDDEPTIRASELRAYIESKMILTKRRHLEAAAYLEILEKFCNKKERKEMEG